MFRIKKCGAPAAFLALVVLAGCADNTTEPDGVTVADLAGSWEGVQFQVTSKANSAFTIDLIGGGGTIRVGVQPQGNFTGSAVLPGAMLGLPEAGVITMPLAGVMRLVDDGTMRIDFIPEIPPLFVTLDADYTLTESTLTIVDDAIDFDFDLDGVKEPSVFRGTLVRN